MFFLCQKEYEKILDESEFEKIGLDKNTPIKEDARADLSTVGITGMKVIEIRGGSDSAELLKPGRYIPAGTSITEELTDTADMLTDKLQNLLDNLNTFTQPDNLNKFIQLVENTTNMLENVNQLIVENRRNLSNTFETTSRISRRLDSLTAELDSSVRKRELVKEIELVVTQARDILQRVDRDVTRGSALFHENMQKLQITLDNLNEASGAVRQDPSVLIWGKESEEIPDKNLEQ